MVTRYYICDQKACPGVKAGVTYCNPCFHTFKPEHAKNPDSVKIAQDFLNHFDIELHIPMGRYGG